MKPIFITVLACSFFMNTYSQTLAGNWEGNISAGGKTLRIVFHITQTPQGYESKFDSPDQLAYGLAVNQTQLIGDSLLMIIDLVKGGYRGKWEGADKVTGYFIQGPAQMPLTLLKTGNAIAQPAAAKFKPQTPVPPFPYSSEEVMYENTEQKVTLAGTFTKPFSGDRFPVVLLITGSGPQDRDESIGMHKPFALIADRLTKAGIAVLRVDDRGIGKSSGNLRTSSSADLATDVMAGIAYLKTRKDIDPSKIGLLGHSEGGLIAPYVASRSKDVAFIIMLAGTPAGGKATMYYQAVTKPLAALSQHDRDAYGKLYTAMYALALDSAAKAAPANYIRKTYLDWKQQQPDTTLQHLVKGTDEQIIANMVQGFSDFTRSWWTFFLGYDLTKDLASIKIPILALNGEKDEQVDPVSNLALIRKIAAKSGNKDVTTTMIPGVNHLFQHCKQCGSVAEYLALEETFDPETLTLITNWVVSHTKK